MNYKQFDYPPVTTNYFKLVKLSEIKVKESIEIILIYSILNNIQGFGLACYIILI